MLCREDETHGRTFRGTALCEPCYRETMERLRLELTPPRRRREAKPIRQSAPAPRPAPKPARVADPAELGRLVWASAANVRSTEAQERLGVSGRHLSRLVADAKAAGWIVSHGKNGYGRGEKKPPEKTDGT